MRISTGLGPRPTNSGFETFSWYFLRISGIVLLVLVIVHLVIMHAANDVSCTTYQFVAFRYANPLWRLFDWLLLTLSLTHGMNGLRIVVDDYVHPVTVRFFVLSALAVLLLIFFMLGTITLITFQPVVGNLGPQCLPR
ncbi:MAG: succinate dehydrogenase, hydrophobic membrane anchor protein [Ktedonobacteraceae bacterium]|nr:succinate dehydrogenase, hydrophobic membrane anchor protein [Ktedonobacteraceae bacterium]